MGWNMVDYMMNHYGNKQYVFTMDFLKNTYDKSRYNDVLKQLKTFKPTVKLEDIIVVAVLDYVNQKPVYGILFTKEHMYVKNQGAYSLYNITNVSYTHRKSGLFSKKMVTDLVITYTDKTVKISVDGVFANYAFGCLNELSKFGRDGQFGITFKQTREIALEQLKNGYDVLFEKFLALNAKEDKEACVMLMNYYFQKGDYDLYRYYKNQAMVLNAPQAYHHEGYMLFKERYYHEAYKNYVKAYAYGIDSSISSDLFKLRQFLKSQSQTVKSPYKYMDLDIDPKMFSCIYPKELYDSYILYLMRSGVEDDVIKKWVVYNIDNKNIIPSEKEEEFYEQFVDVMNQTSTFNVTYYDAGDYSDKLRESLNQHIHYVDSNILVFLNRFDDIVVTELPVGNFNSIRLDELKIGCFLDAREFIGEKQVRSLDSKGAYAYINRLNEYSLFKKKRLNSSREEAIAFLREQIRGYEDNMRIHKQKVNRFMALIYMMATPNRRTKILSFNRDCFLELAKQRVLLMDEKLLEVKNAYFKQLNITDADLIKNTSSQFSIQEVKNAGNVLISKENSYEEYGYFYVYNDDKNLNLALNDFMKKVGVKFNKADILFYHDISISGYSNGNVLTKDAFYSTNLKQPIPLKGLVALKATRYDTLIALYENGKEVEYPYEYSSMYDRVRTINFVNEMLIYLSQDKKSAELNYDLAYCTLAEVYLIALQDIETATHYAKIAKEKGVDYADTVFEKIEIKKQMLASRNQQAVSVQQNEPVKIEPKNGINQQPVSKGTVHTKQESQNPLIVDIHVKGLCELCQLCSIQMCATDAIHFQDGKPMIDYNLCICCGVCVTDYPYGFFQYK